MRKLNYEWRQKTIRMKTSILPLRLLVGAAVAITLGGPLIPANAKNEHEQEHQQQQQQKKAEQQQKRAANQNASRESRNDKWDAQNQARNQERNDAQNEARNQSRNEERNRAAQNQAALNQAQETNRRQNEQANKNAAKARNNEFNRALNQQKKQENKANWNDYKKNERDNNRANAQTNERERQAAIRRENESIEARNRANQQADNHSRNNNDFRQTYRPDKRWDYKLNNRDRYQTYKKYHNNWNEQRTYLRSNLGRFNELANLNRQQQELLDSQMRAAYLQYHNNHYNGVYNWNTYSDPQFIDYIQTRNPSLLQSILGFLGLGDNGDYLYSSNWTDERSELTQNMANIHQLALEGRITPAQESTLLDQLRPQFMDYKNNNWNGSVGWSQYSDPGFVDYLNQKKPSILMTVRDFLVR